MPTYEYRCSKGHHFELFQRISETPVDRCPECGAAAERLLSSGAGLIFKGSGFYITDYRSETYKKAAQSESGAKPESTPKDSGSSASKPESKPSSSGTSKSE
jgi:putative FmdB family regulatory protein